MKFIQPLARTILYSLVIVTILSSAQSTHQHSREADNTNSRTALPPRSLDGSGNHPTNPDLGKAGTTYRRIAPHQYEDNIAEPIDGPNTRYISNRIFSDVAQNLFSENGVTQWAAAWGQFIGHTIGLCDQGAGESAPIVIDVFDPLETFQNDLGVIAFNRTPAATGTGISSVREQLNIVSAYIDAWAVYGGRQAHSTN